MLVLVRQPVRVERNGGQPTYRFIGKAAVVALVVAVIARVGFGRVPFPSILAERAKASTISIHPRDSSLHKNDPDANHSADLLPLPAATPASVKSPLNYSVTIVCELAGGMGNNLEIYAHCYAVSRLLWRNHRLQSRILIRHEESSEIWQDAERDLKSCFPMFRPLNFEGANTPLFQTRKEQQLDVLGPNLTASLHSIFFAWKGHRFLDPKKVDKALDDFTSAFVASRNVPIGATSSLSNHSSIEGSGHISLPFLRVLWLASVDTYMDEMMNELRGLFAFESENGSSTCCAELPNDDETVFHLRNYLAEVGEPTHRNGYDELGPEQTARDLVGHLHPGEKVAILSKFSQESAQRYIDAMERRGLQVRYISGQTGLQDFCFLMRSKKEMIGTAISTYFWWAAYLSNCSKVTAYSVDTNTRRSRFGDKYINYNFTNPLLAGRIFRPLIALDESSERPGG